MKKVIVSFFCACFATIAVGAGKIEYLDTEGVGRGASENAAVESAIIECVSQVNGLAISTKSQLDAVESISDNESFSSQKLQKRVASATKGVVASYEIVSVTDVGDGLKEAVINAKIARYKQGSGANRLRIAVFPFKAAKDKYGVDSVNVSGDDVSRIGTQAFVDKMVAARKFTVLDREYADEILDEKSTIANADTPVEEMCKLGQVLGADYIVVGVVESLTYSKREVKMELSGLKVPVNDAGCSVSIRFIDVATSQIKFSNIINTKVKLSKNIESPVVEIFNKETQADALKISGISTIRSWSITDPRSDSIICGVVRMWSIKTSDTANISREQMRDATTNRGGRTNAKKQSGPSVRSSTHQRSGSTQSLSGDQSKYKTQSIESEDF